MKALIFYIEDNGYQSWNFDERNVTVKPGMTVGSFAHAWYTRMQEKGSDLEHVIFVDPHHHTQVCVATPETLSAPVSDIVHMRRRTPEDPEVDPFRDAARDYVMSLADVKSALRGNRMQPVVPNPQEGDNGDDRTNEKDGGCKRKGEEGEEGDKEE